MTKLTKEHLLKVEKCSPLLPNPGPEVVEELLGHIYAMDAEIADLKRQLRQALAQVEIVDRALGDPGNTSSKVALAAHDAEVWNDALEQAARRSLHACWTGRDTRAGSGCDPRPEAREARLEFARGECDVSELRTSLDAALYNKHNGGSVSSRWTVDSILEAILPVVDAYVQEKVDAKVEEMLAIYEHAFEQNWVVQDTIDAIRSAATVKT